MPYEKATFEWYFDTRGKAYKRRYVESLTEISKWPPKKARKPGGPTCEGLWRITDGGYSMWTGETVARAACFCVRKGERERTCQCGRVIRGGSTHAAEGTEGRRRHHRPSRPSVGFLPRVKGSSECVALSVDDRSR